MKINYLLPIIILLSSCLNPFNQQEEEPPRCYKEQQLSFFDPQKPMYSEGKYQGEIYEHWLRKPENLIMIHETFKKIGYSKLISQDQLRSNPSLLWAYVNKPLANIIDSLLITYPLDSIASTYYREFWERRRGEENDSIVYEILQEVSLELLDKQKVDFEESLVNDTLYHLVLMRETEREMDYSTAVNDFEYLKSIGLHESAYNLLYEQVKYQDIELNRDLMVKGLIGNDTCPNFWLGDDRN